MLFLLALATAKRVGELQALSSVVTFVGGDACLSYVSEFVAKSESLTCSIPRSFLVKSLSDFAAGLDDDLLLCPVRALRVYLDKTCPLAPVRHRLFVSPRWPSRALSKDAVSFFLRDVITAAGAARPEVGSVRAHDIRGVSTSVAFHHNWSVSTVLESATWSSSLVFSSFYLRDIQHEYDGIRSLGPFVAAGSRIEWPSPLPDLLRGRRMCCVALVSASVRLLHLLQWLDAGLPIQWLSGARLPLFSYFITNLHFALFVFSFYLF